MLTRLHAIMHAEMPNHLRDVVVRRANRLGLLVVAMRLRTRIRAVRATILLSKSMSVE
jgi:hypothetical protein